MPDRAYSSVDLPAPEGPITTVKSAPSISRSMFFNTWCCDPLRENVFDSFSVVIRLAMSSTLRPKALKGPCRFLKPF